MATDNFDHEEMIARARGKLLVVGLGRNMEGRFGGSPTWISEAFEEAEFLCVDNAISVLPDIAADFTNSIPELPNDFFSIVYFQHIGYDILLAKANYAIKQAYRILERDGMLAITTGYAKMPVVEQILKQEKGFSTPKVYRRFYDVFRKQWQARPCSAIIAFKK